MNKEIQSVSIQQGFTLVELLIVIAIIGILASLAAPSFQAQMQQQRVEGAAESLAAALHNVKAEAIKTNTTAPLMRIVFTPANTNTTHTTWCYGMPTAGAATCNCTIANDCVAGSVVESTAFSDVSVNFNNTNSRAFNPLRGTGTTGTVTFSTGNNRSLGVTVLGIGRIRICRPTGTVAGGSYQDSGACP